MLLCYQKHGVKITAQKSEVFWNQVRFLWRIVTKIGTQWTLTSLLKERIPKTVREVRKVIRICLLQPVVHWELSPQGPTSLHAAPRNKDTKGESTAKAWEQGEKLQRTPCIVTLTEEHQNVICELIDYLSNPPVLGYPDLIEPFFIHCDVSQVGLGAELYQRQRGKLEVKSIWIKNPNPSRKTSSLWKVGVFGHEVGHMWVAQELCLSFIVYTDNNLLMYSGVKKCFPHSWFIIFLHVCHT